jgi:hypothetical protein
VNKALLFALIFVTIGIFVLGNTALLLFRETKPQDMAWLGFPIVNVLGIAGFAFGWKKRNRS